MRRAALEPGLRALINDERSRPHHFFYQFKDVKRSNAHISFRNLTFSNSHHFNSLVTVLCRVRNSLVWIVEQMMHPLWSSQAKSRRMALENTSAIVKTLLIAETWQCIVTFTTGNVQCDKQRKQSPENTNQELLKFFSKTSLIIFVRFL